MWGAPRWDLEHRQLLGLGDASTEVEWPWPARTVGGSVPSAGWFSFWGGEGGPGPRLTTPVKTTETLRCEMRARVKLDVKFLRESAGLEWVWCGFGGFVLVFLIFLPLALSFRRVAKALHSVRRMMWIPDSVKTGPLISPALSAKEASSKGFCI